MTVATFARVLLCFALLSCSLQRVSNADIDTSPYKFSDQAIAATGSFEWDEMAALYRRELNQTADFITPEQIASAIAYLCTDAAASINGAGLPVDGGLSGAFMQGPVA